MTAKRPSDSFQAWAYVEHNPPDPPFFSSVFGFSSVVADTSVLPSGVYVLTPDPLIDLLNNAIYANYIIHDPAAIDLGVMFTGQLQNIAPDGKIVVVRFQVLPGNILTDGPFAVHVVSAQ